MKNYLNLDGLNYFLNKLSEKINAMFTNYVSYSAQEPTETQQSQARINIDVDYATDQEIIEMMLEEGVITTPTTENGEVASLYVDGNGNAILTKNSLTVDKNGNGTTDANIAIDGNGNAII